MVGVWKRKPDERLSNLMQADVGTFRYIIFLHFRLQPRRYMLNDNHHGSVNTELRRTGTNDEVDREEAGALIPSSSSDHCMCSTPYFEQMQDFMKMYSNLVERCFMSCCNDFTSKALGSKEVRSYILDLS
jgi:hypothetical protein